MIPDSVVEHLDPQEAVIWSAKPERSLFVRRHRTVSALGMLFLAIVVFWFGVTLAFVGANSAVVPSLLFYWGMPSLVVGVLLLYGPLVLASREWRNTLYLLTNRRLIIQHGIFSPRVSYVPLNDLPRIEIDAHEGWGNLLLLGDSSLRRLDAAERVDYQPGALTLRALQDPEQVRDRLLAARAAMKA